MGLIRPGSRGFFCSGFLASIKLTHKALLAIQALHLVCTRCTHHPFRSLRTRADAAAHSFALKLACSGFVFSGFLVLLLSASSSVRFLPRSVPRSSLLVLVCSPFFVSFASLIAWGAFLWTSHWCHGLLHRHTQDLTSHDFLQRLHHVFTPRLLRSKALRSARTW